FDQIITSEAVGCKKPHPEIFNYALSQSGAELTNSVMIGDDLNTDVQGAVNIGMPCIFYNPNKTETILPLLADVSHLLEIKDVL
ncbi:MAG: HAD-IA family hydrolase, partial [Bacteroidota bacterium]|nr:HAD-IA family hydrolase [Bacteroidota bacterium]